MAANAVIAAERCPLAQRIGLQPDVRVVLLTGLRVALRKAGAVAGELASECHGDPAGCLMAATAILYRVRPNRRLCGSGVLSSPASRNETRFGTVEISV